VESAPQNPMVTVQIRAEGKRIGGCRVGLKPETTS
jgi:hypothetical protein